MLKLIIGGAASGKSGFAQNLIEEDAKTGELVYLATMEAQDPESLKRIEKHIGMREGKGYRTIEQARDIEKASEGIKKGSFVLIEDITNLCANEMFPVCYNEAYEKDLFDKSDTDRSIKQLTQKITEGIEELCLSLEGGEVVAVTGELFSDTASYDEDVTAYLKLLSGVNYELAKRADYVAEIICGLPNVIKGKNDCY